MAGRATKTPDFPAGSRVRTWTSSGDSQIDQIAFCGQLGASLAFGGDRLQYQSLTIGKQVEHKYFHLLQLGHCRAAELVAGTDIRMFLMLLMCAGAVGRGKQAAVQLACLQLATGRCRQAEHPFGLLQGFLQGSESRVLLRGTGSVLEAQQIGRRNLQLEMQLVLLDHQMQLPDTMLVGGGIGPVMAVVMGLDADAESGQQGEGQGRKWTHPVAPLMAQDVTL